VLSARRRATSLARYHPSSAGALSRRLPHSAPVKGGDPGKPTAGRRPAGRPSADRSPPRQGAVQRSRAGRGPGAGSAAGSRGDFGRALPEGPSSRRDLLSGTGTLALLLPVIAVRRVLCAASPRHDTPTPAGRQLEGPPSRPSPGPAGERRTAAAWRCRPQGAAGGSSGLHLAASIVRQLLREPPAVHPLQQERPLPRHHRHPVRAFALLFV